MEPFALVSTEVVGYLELYQDLTLNFNFQTSIMANQIVNLENFLITILNFQKTAGEKIFMVNINCRLVMPSKVLF